MKTEEIIKVKSCFCELTFRHLAESIKAYDLGGFHFLDNLGGDIYRSVIKGYPY